MKRCLGMVLVLSLLCALSGVLLSSLKSATAERIAEQVLGNVQVPSLKQVFPYATNSFVAERHVFTLDNQQIMVFPAMENNVLRGVAFEGSGQGYGGDIAVMVGFNLDTDSIAGISATTLKETPGLGMRVTEESFRSQFAGSKAPLKLKADGGTIDGVSGASISSRGVLAAVNQASLWYQKLKPLCLEHWSSAR